MTITIPEVQITSPQINSQRMLVFRVRCKPEDFTEEVRNAIFDASDNWTPLALVLAEFQWERKEDPLPKMRSKLAFIMKQYAEKQWMNENDILQKLYLRHWVTSRTELTEEQLKEEIDRYEAGLNYD